MAITPTPIGKNYLAKENDMENKEIRIGNVTVKDFGRIKITNADGYSEEASVRYMDEHHFEMSNIHGEFDAIGSHVWANTEYEIFNQIHGITIVAL